MHISVYCANGSHAACPHTAHCESAGWSNCVCRCHDKSTCNIIRRCTYCNVLLDHPVIANAKNNVSIACAVCSDVNDARIGQSEYRVDRQCACGDPLDDHEQVDVKSDGPAPCNACGGCKDFKEARY